MTDESHEDGVLRIEALVPEGDADESGARRVQVWFVAGPSAPLLAMSGLVTSSSPPDPVIGEDGQRLCRLQIEVSLEEVLSLWNSIADVQSGSIPQAVSSCGKSRFSMGKLVGPADEPDPPS